ncbi:MAG: hypothetical protein ABL961_14120 [Vicinamibacterales bacterium]
MAAAAAQGLSGRTITAVVAVVRGAATEGTAETVAAVLATTKTIRAPSGLANGELCRLTGHRWLTIDSRQLRTNQRPMGRPLFYAFDARRRRRRISEDLIDLLVMGRPHLTARRQLAGVRVRRPGNHHLNFAGATGRNAPRHGNAYPGDHRRIGLLPHAGYACVLVIMFGVAGPAAGKPDVVTNHGDHSVIRETALARTVVVQNVTKPRLALLHQECSRRTQAGGEKLAKCDVILAELEFVRQES